MTKPFIEMPKLPDGIHLQEYPAVMIHGAGEYKIYMDGLDCYICESRQETARHGSLEFLVKTHSAEITERIAIALLRAAEIQRSRSK